MQWQNIIKKIIESHKFFYSSRAMIIISMREESALVRVKSSRIPTSHLSHARIKYESRLHVIKVEALRHNFDHFNPSIVSQFPFKWYFQVILALIMRYYSDDYIFIRFSFYMKRTNCKSTIHKIYKKRIENYFSLSFFH